MDMGPSASSVVALLHLSPSFFRVVLGKPVIIIVMFNLQVERSLKLIKLNILSDAVSVLVFYLISILLQNLELGHKMSRNVKPESTGSSAVVVPESGQLRAS